MPEPASISVLCFSKDRPMQLEAYLRSLSRMCEDHLPCSVLYTCRPRFQQAYSRLKSLFPKVDFVQETNFKSQVIDCLHKAESPLFMFGCDDVIFKGPWRPREIRNLFQVFPRLLAFSLRLGKEITYSHPADRTMRAPDFLQTDPFLIWRWPAGKVDWGYPWELDCTIYTVNFVRSMLEMLEKFDCGHPNRLEGNGANLIRRTVRAGSIPHSLQAENILTFAKGLLRPVREDSLDRSLRRFEHFDLMGSYPLARASVVTINRVQDVFPNRIYGNGKLTADELLRQWDRGVILDTDRYIGQSYSSIHIGETHFSHRS